MPSWGRGERERWLVLWLASRTACHDVLYRFALLRSCSAASSRQTQLLQLLIYVLLDVHKTQTWVKSHKEGIRGRHSLHSMTAPWVGLYGGGGAAESIEWFTENQAFLRPDDLPLCQPLSPLPSVSSIYDTQEHLERHLAGRRRGVSEEPNHDTTRKPGPLCIIQYSLGLQK